MNKGGRPAEYHSPEELQQAIDDYFKNGIRKKTVQTGPGKTIEIEVPTITGLAYHLGFQSRQSFYDYEKRPLFSYTIKRARLFIEKHYEEMLQAGNPTGAIFALKNFDWKDKQDVQATTVVKDERIDLSTLSDEELATFERLADKARKGEA